MEDKTIKLKPLILATFLMVLLAWSAQVASGGDDRSTDPAVHEEATQVQFTPVKLPDGTDFQTWEQPFTFRRTYHVAQQHPAASDNNRGTAEAPWRTISKAAQVLRPGSRVIVHAGIYREWVKPARGGTGPDKIISYEAAPGERVVIKGSDIWKPKWQKSRYRARLKATTWQATIDGLERTNPFYLINGGGGSELRRGQVFVDGVKLAQVVSFSELDQQDGAFWVDVEDGTLHVRLPGDAEPADQVFEITTRAQVFAPVEPCLNYIRVKGFVMLHAANQVPRPLPQQGLLGTTAGHHWIIEDCEIGYPNTLGMSIGAGLGSATGELQGYHIIRRNHIHHCGVSAISGWMYLQNTHLLIEDNLITDNCWMLIGHWENGGVKIHGVENSVIRRNVILRTGMAVQPEDPGQFPSCASLWFDGFTYNTRITQNLIAGHGKTPLGMIFIELSEGPILVDNNLVVSSGHSGIYEHDTARMVVVQNLSANGPGAAVRLSYGYPPRTPRQINDAGEFINVEHVYENHHRVYGNILSGFSRYICFPNPTGRSDYNVLAGIAKSSKEDLPRPFQILGDQGVELKPKNAEYELAEWRTIGNDVHSVEVPMEVIFDDQRMELRVKAAPGVELPVFSPVPKLPPVAPSGIDWHFDAHEWLSRDSEKHLSEYRRYGGWIRRPIPEVAPLEELLTVDLLGRPRDPDKFQAGPLLDLPLDGTPVRVDPRNR